MLFAIGAADQITGVTHECKYPDDAKSKPKVINSSFDATSMTSREIDNKKAEGDTKPEESRLLAPKIDLGGWTTSWNFHFRF